MKLLRKYSISNFLQHIKTFFCVCFISLFTSLSVSFADPEGAQVVNGQVSFQRNGYNTTITASDKSIINYTSFDIARPEIVQFIQPNSSASVLNRIQSANPTNINGTLLANGRVFFVNPAGVIFGAGAKINVNQLVASSLNITDSDFINGQYNFAGGNGSVINRGDITAEKVYLIGKQVANSGNIHCPDGCVVMAAGDRVFLSEPGSNVRVEIEPEISPEQNDMIYSDPEVQNEEIKDAAEGRIVLASGDLFSKALTNIDSLAAIVETGNSGQVSNTGIIEAKSETSSGGTVIAKASEIINTGTMDVTGSVGGKVNMEATEQLGQFGTIHADGNTGNGGNVELAADNVVTLGSDSLTTANAATEGDGGEVIVYSPDTVLFQEGAKIEAKGGNESGDGGFIEVSGKKYVEVCGQVNASAEVGKPGTFQIDPMNVNIQNTAGTMDPGVDGAFTPPTDASTVSDDAIEGWLNGGTNVEIIATGDVIGRGNITQDEKAQIEKTSGGDATIKFIGNNIALDGGIVSESGKLGVRLDADGNVTLKAEIDTNGGRFTSSGDVFDNTEGTITTAGGTVKFEHSGEMNLGSVDAQDGTVKIAAGTINDSENDPEEDITGGLVKLSAQGGTIGPLDVSASNHLYAATLKDAGDIIISSPGTLDDISAWSAGDVSITSTGDGDSNKIDTRTDEELVNQEEEGSLIIDSMVALNGSIDVVADGDITVSDRAEAQNSLKLHSGADGSGDISFEPGAVLASEEIELRAGDGLDLLDENHLLDLVRKCRITPDEVSWLGGGGSGAKVEFEGLEIAPGNNTLTIWQDAFIELMHENSQFEPDDAHNIDLILQSDDGYITSTTADNWKSITANARDGIKLEGSGNITTNDLRTRTGNITVHSTGGDMILNGDINAHWPGGPDCLGCSEPPLECKRFPEMGFIYNIVKDYLWDEGVRGGGVELIADEGWIFTNGNDALNEHILNVKITGTWDANPKGIGVPLPGDERLAAIIISSQENLHLGPLATLEILDGTNYENKSTNDATVDEREAIDFLTGPPGSKRAGDPIDVSIYLRSKSGNVKIESEAKMDNQGAMVIDAEDKVEEFGDLFVKNWVTTGFPRLEVVSRTTQTLNQAAVDESLPGARDMLEGKVPTWIMDAVDAVTEQTTTESETGSSIVSGQNDDESAWSKYVLRGGSPGQVLAFVELFAGSILDWRDFQPSIFRIELDEYIEQFKGPNKYLSRFVRRMQELQKKLFQRDKQELSPTHILLSNGILRNGKWISLNPHETTVLQKDDTVIVSEDYVGFIKFNNIDNIVNIFVEPDSEVKYDTPRGVRLYKGKIWFWTEQDAIGPFKIRTYNGHIIEIKGAASGSVSVDEEDTNDRTVTIGPIITGQVHISRPDVISGYLNSGWWAIPDGKTLIPKEVPESVFSQTKEEFESIKQVQQGFTLKERDELIMGWGPYLRFKALHEIIQ